MSRLPTGLLRMAYAQGYFPMPHPDTGEIVWFRPDPRAVLPLDGFKASRSLLRSIRRSGFRVSYDTAFPEVMRGCADREETWITDEFLAAYGRLHREGDAHSVEIWQGPNLVGGVYGVSLGGAFFAESKFHRVTDASKAALYYLVERLRARGYGLLEIQFLTPHLETLGAIEIPDAEYQARLSAALQLAPKFA
jgi:leucyl/phenylalanyl-tRNA--protein transferase